MTMQTVSPLNAGFITADGTFTGSNVGDHSAGFADLVASVMADAGSPPSPQEIRAADNAHMMQRIAQVGFAGYIREQQQERKMLRVLGILEAESPTDIQTTLRKIQYDFERNPPDGLQDMYARLDQAVSAIPKTADHDLRTRMEAIAVEIHRMMNEPDDALARREEADGLTAVLGG
jgi:hypothetical protein